MPSACKHGRHEDYCGDCLAESYVAKFQRLQGIMQNDILSALDDCVDLGMSATETRDVIRVIVGKALAP